MLIEYFGTEDDLLRNAFEGLEPNAVSNNTPTGFLLTGTSGETAVITGTGLTYTMFGPFIIPAGGTLTGIEIFDPDSMKIGEISNIAWPVVEAISAIRAFVDDGDAEDLEALLALQDVEIDASNSTDGVDLDEFGLEFTTVLTAKGSDFADRFIGGSANDLLSGLDGNDSLLGGGGNDQLRGGQGIDEIFGEAGNDKLFGERGSDLLNGGKGRDILNGGLGSDTAIGGKGNDRLNGNDGADELIGGAGADTLSGGKAQDVLSGGDSADDLLGGGGRDVLFGNAGRDMLNGGLGNDTMTGGRGIDTFVFNAAVNQGRDIITDFDLALDVISISNAVLDDITFGRGAGGANTRLVLDSGSEIVVQGVAFADADQIQLSFV